MRGRREHGAEAGRWRRAHWAAAVGLGLSGALVACSSSSTTAPSTSPARSLTAAPNPSSFSGEPPSALASLASSASAVASAAQQSAEAAASSFAASASDRLTASRDKATSVLNGVQGGGNALGDVVITGVPHPTSGGLHAAIVTITNSTGGTLSYAVQVNFNDASGQMVDSTVVWAENLPAGQRAQPVAFSSKPADLALVPVAVKAQRY
ncbi:FxLYD domain-containing protein [Kitasatospora sp. NPDC058965]|uniref:FxLYD domain-containing protein n=1 Tax=Kitasatospora sp. NPDC058965 TaxID=3346682 RepID=UPI003689C3DD